MKIKNENPNIKIEFVLRGEMRYKVTKESEPLRKTKNGIELYLEINPKLEEKGMRF